MLSRHRWCRRFDSASCRADGSEPFDTMAGGVGAVEHPDSGEVVWCDAAGVTCRRWNWRQARRTQLRPGTTTALFILDALEPLSDAALSDAALSDAAEDLAGHLAMLGPDVQIASRLIVATSAPQEPDVADHVPQGQP